MCAFVASASSHGMLSVYVCVDLIVSPSGRLTLTLLGPLKVRILQSGVVSENWLIASKNAVNDAFHLVRDEYHKNRTKVEVVELY